MKNMNTLIQTTKQTLSEFGEMIALLNDEQFSRPLLIFSGSSVGMHARHVLEFYQCLLMRCDTQTINYDHRQRDLLLQTQTSYFNITIEKIIEYIDNLDNYALNTPLSILSDLEGEGAIKSSFARELQYNLEHTIHHSALIKIGILTLVPNAILPPTFGVAPSTIRYQQQKIL
jgi:uncharacterized damage-inducible protein DinB